MWLRKGISYWTEQGGAWRIAASGAHGEGRGIEHPAGTGTLDQQALGGLPAWLGLPGTQTSAQSSMRARKCQLPGSPPAPLWGHWGPRRGLAFLQAAARCVP